MARTTETQAAAKEQEVKKGSQQQPSASEGKYPLSTRDDFAFPSFATPFSLMRRFSEEMGRLFEDFGFGGSHFLRGFPTRRESVADWAPRVEAFERQGRFVVRAELPGVAKEDVKVDVTNDILTIQGERRHESEEKREGFYRSECSYGHFYRSVPLPDGVNTEDATAKFQDGVLQIEMAAPARTPIKGRKIEIQESTKTA
jgi:HSP20 family protein